MSAEQEGGSGPKPRVLIPVTILFAVRYLIRTGLIDRLRDVCEPVLALSWDDPDLVAELQGDSQSVVRLPDAEVGRPSLAVFNQLELHFARRLSSPSTPIDRSRRHIGRPLAIRLRRWAAWQRARLLARRPGDEARLLADLEGELASGSNLQENRRFLAEHRIDAVFSVTPFAAQERVVLLAAATDGLPCCTSILSFDNITTRPPLPIAFDRYLVWNRFNKAEILRSYLGVTPAQIAVVGPAQFDFYSDPAYVEDRSEWRDRTGLGENPTVLYGAGAPEVAPHEQQYVDDLCRAVDTGELPGDLRILLRRHPVDQPERWERFRSHPAVVFDDPGRVGTTPNRPGQVDIGRDQIAHLCSALAHTEVHVNVSSTLTLDGAFFGKPQIGPAYDATPGAPYRRMATDLYRREHFLPIVASGGLELARSPAELVTAVRRALDHPARLEPQRRAMLDALCTYTDGRCTDRVAEQVRSFLDSI